MAPQPHCISAFFGSSCGFAASFAVVATVEHELEQSPALANLAEEALPQELAQEAVLAFLATFSSCLEASLAVFALWEQQLDLALTVLALVLSHPPQSWAKPGRATIARTARESRSFFMVGDSLIWVKREFGYAFVLVNNPRQVPIISAFAFFIRFFYRPEIGKSAQKSL
ncbi:MAG: hypothetical protein ACI97A_000849 [Planctomycetota bacterium]|jgi:hypothetical protein